MKESESRRLLLTSRKGIGPGAGFRTRQPCHLGGKSGSFQISPLRPRQLHAEARTWSERTGSLCQEGTGGQGKGVSRPTRIAREYKRRIKKAA